MAKWIFVAAVAALSIAAEAYPDRVIKAVVPYTAGGPIDVTAESLRNVLAKCWAIRSSSRTVPVPA
jgi:tripartite-type tricarboxylate transporter receptor subunit TctC